jgi:hypothetical protein
MNSTTKTFGPAKVKFYSNYDIWAFDVNEKGWHLIVTGGGTSAQDALGTCRGFWGRHLKKGWLDI